MNTLTQPCRYAAVSRSPVCHACRDAITKMNGPPVKILTATGGRLVNQQYCRHCGSEIIARRNVK